MRRISKPVVTEPYSSAVVGVTRRTVNQDDISPVTSTVTDPATGRRLFQLKTGVYHPATGAKLFGCELDIFGSDDF